MILIFDLDDTLYEEITFVISGFKEVAKFMNFEHQINENKSIKLMKNSLKRNGRGKIFDDLLEANNLYSKKMLKKCISIYRTHKPNINLSKSAELILSNWKNKIYLVTDGNKLVQANKIKALKINQFFKKIYITHNYGLNKAKPSPYCFDLIRKEEKCRWEDLIYVGDNPAKDFVSLNLLGSVTIRVLTGSYSKKEANKGYDATYSINNLNKLETLIKKIEEIKEKKN
tara:strand:+ start:63844 stop:64527 length:684 start_codon:yes stop_codon:yes gene_type:complete